MKHIINQAKENVIMGSSPTKSVSGNIAKAITSMKVQNAYIDDDPSFFDE